MLEIVISKSIQSWGMNSKHCFLQLRTIVSVTFYSLPSHHSHTYVISRTSGTCTLHVACMMPLHHCPTTIEQQSCKYYQNNDVYTYVDCTKCSASCVQIGQLQNLLQFQISSTSLYHFYWQKLVNFLVIDLHDLKNVSSNDMKTLSYTSIKCSLNKFCKNNYLKSKINELVLNVNKIIVEAYVLANLHII